MIVKRVYVLEWTGKGDIPEDRDQGYLSRLLSNTESQPERKCPVWGSPGCIVESSWVHTLYAMIRFVSAVESPVFFIELNAQVLLCSEPECYHTVRSAKLPT